MKTIIYTRVSTEEQALEGASLAAQDALARQFCEANGHTVEAVIVDAGVSGSVPLSQREGGKLLLSSLKSGWGVVVWRLDRLFRSALDTLSVVKDLDARRISLLTVEGSPVDTSTATGKFILTTLASAAELERNLIGERVKMAMRHKGKTSRVSRFPPFGFDFDDDGNLIAVEAEQKSIARVRYLHDVDGLSCAKIAKILDSEGMPPRGKGWHRQTVSRILARK